MYRCDSFKSGEEQNIPWSDRLWHPAFTKSKYNFFTVQNCGFWFLFLSKPVFSAHKASGLKVSANCKDHMGWVGDKWHLEGHSLSWLLGSGNTTTIPSCFFFSSQFLRNLHNSSDNVPKQEKKNLTLLFKAPAFPYPQRSLISWFIYTSLIFMAAPLWSHVISKAPAIFYSWEGPALITGAIRLNRTLFLLRREFFPTALRTPQTYFYNAQQLLYLVFLWVLQMLWVSGGTLMFSKLPDLWEQKIPPFPNYFLSPCIIRLDASMEI